MRRVGPGETGSRAGERGGTVVELLVVSGLLVIAGVFTVSGLVQGFRGSEHAHARIDALTDTQTGIERVSRELRAAHPLREAAPTEATVDVRRDGRLHHLRYRTEESGDGGWDLVQDRWTFTDPDEFDAPDFSPTEADADTTTTRVLVPDLANAEVFTYYDRDGSVLPTREPDEVARDTRGVSIAVERSVQDERQPIRVETTVQIRNE